MCVCLVQTVADVIDELSDHEAAFVGASEQPERRRWVLAADGQPPLQRLPDVAGIADVVASHRSL